MLTREQQKQLVFLHHALWSFAKSLQQDQSLLASDISEFRNRIEPHVRVGEDKYCQYIDKGGIILLQTACL